MFPLSIIGDIHGTTFGKPTSDVTIINIANDLRKQKIILIIENNIISFENNTFYQWSFRRYVMVSKGKFRIETDDTGIHIIYNLQFSKLLFYATLVIFIFGFVIFAADNISILQKIYILFGGWLWLCGANYFLVLIRTRLFLRSLLI